MYTVAEADTRGDTLLHSLQEEQKEKKEIQAELNMMKGHNTTVVVSPDVPEITYVFAGNDVSVVFMFDCCKV
jgi:hypothetical protein